MTPCCAAEECKDWWVHFRRAGTPVRYGHAIQLLHSGSGELLATRYPSLIHPNEWIALTFRPTVPLRLKQSSSSSSTLYELGLDTSLPDPYLEGR